MWRHPELIIEEECGKRGVKVKDLLSRRRTKNLVTLRRYIAKRIKAETYLSLGEIGIELGGRDHTTILHLLRT